MKIALTVLELIVSIILIISVILQSGRDAGFSGSIAGSSSSLSGNKAKGIDDLYKKITGVSAVLFIVLALVLVALH